MASVGEGPKPLTKQRSPWTQLPPDPQWVAALSMAGGLYLGAFARNVHDGRLRVILSDDAPHESGVPGHLHLSISHTPASKKRAPRYPTWDEIAGARYDLLPSDLHFAMVLPPPDTYVAHHDTTFHLHQTDDPNLVGWT